MNKIIKRIILLDLDGVLNEYKGNFHENYIPSPKKGVEIFLKKLSLDFKLVLFTSRNKLKASKWLIENGLDKYFSDVTNVKIPACLIIDDRCLKFNGDFDTLYNLRAMMNRCFS